MDRRTTIKWVLAASATWPLLVQREARAYSAPTARGYGTDPNLSVKGLAGEPWPLTMSAAQRRLAGILCDIIIPADDRSQSATAAGVVDFIDEWVSAPYPDFQRDRGIVLGGLAWLDNEADRRFGKEFFDLEAVEQLGICDDICDESRAADALREAARFFALYRDLTAGGFYSSPHGRKDLDYIGNVPLKSFDGPPTALLKSLGLA
ncbi:MAG: gluconate 2-dehydrogenase subunit 3 family protein [Gammaproteobacteria bacterium]